jgi:cytochrome c oxidase subunit 4
MSDHAHVTTHAPEGATTKLFLMVWIGLLILTMVEVFLAYMHTPLHIMLIILIGLSTIKAAMIIAYFMHMKYEKVSLAVILFPMTVFCICAMFIVVPDAIRSLALRP